MREITALLSHPVGGKNDTAAIRNILQLSRASTRKNGDTLHLMAPYLLHAETLDSDRLQKYRIGCARGLVRNGAAVHDELHLYGTRLCEAMRADILSAQERGIPIRAQNATMRALLHEVLEGAVLAAAQ